MLFMFGFFYKEITFFFKKHNVELFEFFFIIKKKFFAKSIFFAHIFS